MLNYFTKQIQKNLFASRDLNICIIHFLTLAVITNKLKICTTRENMGSFRWEKSMFSLICVMEPKKLWNPCCPIKDQKDSTNGTKQSRKWWLVKSYRQTCSLFLIITNSKLPHNQTNLCINLKIISLWVSIYWCILTELQVTAKHTHVVK